MSSANRRSCRSRRGSSSKGRDADGEVYLHRLADARDFALLLTHADVVDSDAFALALLDDPRYEPRRKVILHQAPTLVLDEGGEAGNAEILRFAPEAIDIDIDAKQNSVLSLAMPQYPGWRARLDGVDLPILRAYAGLSAVEIPAGRHRLALRYEPLSYSIGAIISLVTWAGLLLAALVSLARRRA